MGGWRRKALTSQRRHHVIAAQKVAQQQGNARTEDPVTLPTSQGAVCAAPTGDIQPFGAGLYGSVTRSKHVQVKVNPRGQEGNSARTFAWQEL